MKTIADVKNVFVVISALTKVLNHSNDSDCIGKVIDELTSDCDSEAAAEIGDAVSEFSCEVECLIASKLLHKDIDKNWGTLEQEATQRFMQTEFQKQFAQTMSQK